MLGPPRPNNLSPLLRREGIARREAEFRRLPDDHRGCAIMTTTAARKQRDVAEAERSTTRQESRNRASSDGAARFAVANSEPLLDPALRRPAPAARNGGRQRPQPEAEPGPRL